MSDFVQLRSGMRVMIPSPHGVRAGYFSSAIRRIDRRGLLMDIPRRDGEDLPLKAGQSLTMFVQVHGRMYEFESRVREVDLQALFDEPAAAKRTERRSFFRLMVTIACSVTTRPTDGSPAVSHDARIVDLSGGGVRIHTAAEFTPGAEVDLEFLLNGAPTRLRAEVLGTSLIDLARGAIRHEAHCMFTEITGSEQDRIIRYLFEKQREYSKRGVA